MQTKLDQSLDDYAFLDGKHMAMDENYAKLAKNHNFLWAIFAKSNGYRTPTQVKNFIQGVKVVIPDLK